MGLFLLPIFNAAKSVQGKGVWGFRGCLAIKPLIPTHL